MSGRFVRFAAIAIVLASASLAACGPDPDEIARVRANDPRPDVLLVVIDTLRPDHLGAYGYERPTSPRIDRLAREGVLFETAYSPMGTTSPSHATLFTSRLPLSHGLVRNGYRLADSETTLAERASAAGYATAAFVSSYPVSRRFGFAQGFEHFDDDFSGQPGTLHLRRWEGMPVTEVFDRRGEDTVDRAIEWLKRTPADRPLFLWVHLFDPHDPWRPPAPYDALFATGRPRTLQHRIGRYDGEVRYADEQVGRLLAAFDARAEAGPPPLVALTSDHGEGLGQHGSMIHNRFVYDSEVRIPLILRWPGELPAGHRSSLPAHLVDLAPTLAAAMQLPSGQGADFRGVDLLPAARLGRADEPDPERDLWLQRPWYAEGRPKLGEKGPGFGLRKGRFKLIETPEEGRRELYDLVADPGELTNLAATRPELAAQLARRIEQWRARTEPAGHRNGPSEVDPEVEDALRALGYAD